MWSRIPSYKLSQVQKERIDLLNELRGVVFMIQDSEYSVYEKHVQEVVFRIRRIFSVRDVNRLVKLVDVIATSEDGFAEASEQIIKMIERIKESARVRPTK